MARRHVIKHRVMMTGNTIEEENDLYMIRSRRSDRGQFEVNSYENYLWKKANNRLKEEI